MDPIKEAFKKVREEINYIHSEVFLFKGELKKLNLLISELQKEFSIIKEKNEEKTENIHPTHSHNSSTSLIVSPTHLMPFKPLKDGFLPFSTGNEGVPTNRQTDKPTDKQTQINHKIPLKLVPEFFKESSKKSTDSFEDALKILESLDSVKKELRIKFKRLTDQELLIFSTLYQQTEEKGFSDYKTIAEKLNLSESSIRDYVGRLLKKEIPIEKNKINNKTINLTISESFKKIASLSTILKLREF